MRLPCARTSRHRAAVVTAIALLPALAGASANGAPAAVHSSTRVVVVGGGSSTQRDILSLLAGSPTTLVYARAQLHTASLRPADAGNRGVSPATIVVRSRSGSSQVLTGDAYQLGHWSLVGSLLSASNGLHHAGKRTAAWWNLATHRHGTVTVVGKQRYLSSAPGGVLFMNQQGTITRASTSGKTTTYSQMFSARPVGVFPAADDHGLVVGDSVGQARYIAFAAPRKVRHLQTGTRKYVLCQDVSTSYASCTSGGLNGDGFVPSGAILIPLDGSAPTTYHGPVITTAVSGKRVDWEENTVIPGHHPKLRLGSMAAGGSSPTFANHLEVAYTQLKSAYGEVLLTPPNQHRILQAPTVHHVSTLLVAPRSPVTVSTFALAPGRAVDIDDAPDSATPAAPTSARSRPLAVSGGQVASGASHVIGQEAAGRNLDVHVVAASAGATAYLQQQTVNHGGRIYTLKVVGPRGTTTIDDVAGNRLIALSGNRLLYAKSNPGQVTPRLHLRDLVTGTDTVITRLGDQRKYAAAGWGHYVAYATGRASIVRENIETGKKVTLSPSLAKTFESIRVYEYGNNVGWDIVQGNGGHPRRTERIRNAQTLAPAAHLRGKLVGLNPSGALLRTDNRLLLRSWSGTTHVVLSGQAHVSTPELLGRALSWLDGNDELKVAAVSATLPSPRFLGDPDAPMTFARSSSTTWRLTAPYSLPLTHCTVTLSWAGKPVRQLTCAAAQAGEGIADVTWNGKDANGHSPSAGSYHWAIHASGESGNAQRESGAAGPVSGTVDVT